MKKDVVFLKYKLAIFVDGDFWHRYDFEEKRKKLSGSYWPAKIETNILRDERSTRDLKKLGWKVLRFWEDEVKKNPEKAVRKVMRILEKGKMP